MSGIRRTENSASGAWSSSRAARAREEVGAVNDKFAAAFGRSGGGGRGGEDRDRERSERGGDRSERGGDRRGFGGRDGGDAAPLKMNSRNFGDSAPREERERGGYGDRDRERGGFGDRERGFGDRDRERGDERDRRDDRPTRGNFGGEGEERPARGGFGGDREYRPRERRDEGGWEDDPRFASKFGASSRGGGDRRGGDRDRGERGGDRRGGGDRSNSDFMPRRERDAFSSNVGREEALSMPLPTAPKSAASNSATVPKQSVFDMALSKGSKQSKLKPNKTKTEDSTPSTPSVPVAAEPVVAEVQKPSNSKAETAEVVTAALTAQHKGDALAAAITSGYAAKDVTLPISIFAVVSTIIQHVAASPEAFSGKWYKPEEYGAALKAVMSGRSLKEQIDGLYAVQDYCSRNRFPKLDVKGKQKKLIEVIMTALLVSEVVDVDTILAWADDEADRDDVPGRVDAIVQMTAMLTTLREPDDVEEEDLDEEALTRQYVR